MSFIKMNATGKVEVDIKEYNSLVLRDEELSLLESGGVDNWEWYGESLNPEPNADDHIEVDGEKLTGLDMLEY